MAGLPSSPDLCKHPEIKNRAVQKTQNKFLKYFIAIQIQLYSWRILNIFDSVCQEEFWTHKLRMANFGIENPQSKI